MDMTEHRLESPSAVGDKILGFRPLYRQVREILVKRIADHVWHAGQLLPSEPDIAAELGVSQGTVRKALDEMAAESLVVRRQGRGTFVAQHDDARILFQFFKLVPDDGERRMPESKLLQVDISVEPVAAERLGISPDEPIIIVDRLRILCRAPCVLERIHLPAGVFPGLQDRKLPNNLYELYSRAFGITIGRASERLKAVTASATEADRLGVAPGHPLLQVDRIAFSLDGRRVEWRVSLCRTEAVHYASEVH
jgi:GntR family transcriptional regulator